MRSMTRFDAASTPLDARDLEIRSALGLMRVKGIGPMRASKLVGAFGTARSVLGASTEDLIRTGTVNEAGVRAIRKARPVAVDDPALVFYRKNQESTGILLFADTTYPSLLRKIAQPPMLLWTRGGTMPRNAPFVAIVGSRRATERGKSLAYKWAYRLAAAGVVVVSGLAKGIDAAAHEGALGAGGYTVAVMGTGIDRVYPGTNRRLAEEISTSGLLLSEFDPGLGARTHHFPQRNRIIAGMSHVVIVVEAEEESGSLITARLAQDEGRDVGLVPGWPEDPKSAGTNAAIQESLGGLVRAPDDVFRLLAMQPDLAWRPPDHEQAALEAGLSPAPGTEKPERRAAVRTGTPAGAVRQRLKQEPSSLDELMSDTGMERSILEETLLDLLLENRIQLGQDHRYRWNR